MKTKSDKLTKIEKGLTLMKPLPKNDSQGLNSWHLIKPAMKWITSDGMIIDVAIRNKFKELTEV